MTCHVRYTFFALHYASIFRQNSCLNGLLDLYYNKLELYQATRGKTKSLLGYKNFLWFECHVRYIDFVRNFLKVLKEIHQNGESHLNYMPLDP